MSHEISPSLYLSTCAGRRKIRVRKKAKAGRLTFRSASMAVEMHNIEWENATVHGTDFDDRN
jgi:hypothetical protein